MDEFEVTAAVAKRLAIVTTAGTLGPHHRGTATKEAQGNERLRGSPARPQRYQQHVLPLKPPVSSQHQRASS